MEEGVLDEVDRLLERHQEAGHRGSVSVSGLPCLDLLDEEGDHGAAGVHDVAVARHETVVATVGLLRANAWAVFSMSALVMPIALTG
jgi:hypothetical protein